MELKIKKSNEYLMQKVLEILSKPDLFFLSNISAYKHMKKLGIKQMLGFLAYIHKTKDVYKL